MKVFNAIILIAILLSVRISYSQTQPSQNRDFYKTKAPSIKNNQSDTNELFEEDNFDGNEEDNQPVKDYNPKKSMSLVSEDTTSSEEGETSIVEVSEQIKIDSTWITYAEYFAVWDSRNVNPYKIDGSKFDDTLNLTLYDSANRFNYHMPITDCKTTSMFGMRHSRWHYGIDLDLETGEPVFAAFDGLVRISQFDGRGYGNYVLLRHYNGFETLYGHLSRQDVRVGQLVKAGEQIGLGGSTGRSTGSHLHYEVRYQGNAIDPEHMYDFQGNKLRSKIFKLGPVHFDYLKGARKVYYHRIRSGETLSTIARKYKVSLSAIYKMNRISGRTVIRPGRKIRIR